MIQSDLTEPFQKVTKNHPKKGTTNCQAFILSLTSFFLRIREVLVGHFLDFRQQAPFVGVYEKYTLHASRLESVRV